MPTVPCKSEVPFPPAGAAGEKPLALMGEGLPPCKGGEGSGFQALREEGVPEEASTGEDA
jgi:hypothetical protein